MNTSLVITSVLHPNKILKEYGRQSIKNKILFILIGDRKTPPDFKIKGCNYISLKMQWDSDFKLARKLPENHYSRKNLGYLSSMEQKAELIIETDDDNLPLNNFWKEKSERKKLSSLCNKGAVNIYRYFTSDFVWPRGFPLEFLRKNKPLNRGKEIDLICPIQQGLVDSNPDVDAIYRLLCPLPVRFKKNIKIALGKNSWCPFNSQNTTWFKRVFPLMYLPSYCSFRMTDIWRSYIAQRICFENDWYISFESPTVIQKRNPHNLLRDFREEIPGYLNNNIIINALEKLNLKQGEEFLESNLFECYEKLVSLKLIDKKEIGLLEAWSEDIKNLNLTSC